MDIEQLRLILDTVKGISGDAQSVAVWWIVIDKLVPIIGWLSVFGVTVWRVPHFIRLCNNSDKFIAWARDELRIGCHGYLSDSERSLTEEALRDLVKKHKSSNQ